MDVVRVGLMTYLALERGAQVSAVAVIGAPTDLSMEAYRRPERGGALYRELMPDFDHHGDQLLRERCVLDFAEESGPKCGQIELPPKLATQNESSSGHYP